MTASTPCLWCSVKTKASKRLCIEERTGLAHVFSKIYICAKCCVHQILVSRHLHTRRKDTSSHLHTRHTATIFTLPPITYACTQNLETTRETKKSCSQLEGFLTSTLTSLFSYVHDTPEKLCYWSFTGYNDQEVGILVLYLTSGVFGFLMNFRTIPPGSLDLFLALWHGYMFV